MLKLLSYPYFFFIEHVESWAMICRTIKIENNELTETTKIRERR